MQNLSERRFNHFKRWDTRVQERSQNNGCKIKDFDNDGADLSDKYTSQCDSYGWVNRKTFEGHVRDVVLEIRNKDGQVMSEDGLQLPWDAPDSWVLAIHRKEDVNMINK